MELNIMNVFNKRLAIHPLKPLIVCLYAITIGGCCTFNADSPYRFDIAFDSAPTAYRNNSNTSENLNIPIRISNLTNESICLAGKPNDDGWATGMIVSAKVLSTPNFLESNTATTIYGFKSGKTIKAITASDEYSAWDPHNRAVKKLGSSAPLLLGLNDDDIKSTYKATGNEAFLVVSFPIDWSAVPSTPHTFEEELVLEISFSFQDCAQNVFNFDQTFQHRTKIYLTNGPRGMRVMRTGGNSPRTGSFIKVEQ